MWANRYVRGRGWGEAGQAAGEPRGFRAWAVEPGGTGWVVWPLRDPNDPEAVREMYATAYTDGGWQSDDLIQGSLGAPADLPSVAIASNGAPVAAWGQRGSNDLWEVWAARYGADGGWMPAQRVAIAGVAGAPLSVATGADGTIVVAWYSFDPDSEEGLSSTWLSELLTDGTWSEPFRLGRGPATFAEPSVVVHPDGTRLAVWEESDGFENVLWSREYR